MAAPLSQIADAGASAQLNPGIIAQAARQPRRKNQIRASGAIKPPRSSGDKTKSTAAPINWTFLGDLN